MLRSTATRSLLKSLKNAPSSRSAHSAASATLQKAHSLHQLTSNRPKLLVLRLPSAVLTTKLYATKASPPPFDPEHPKLEHNLGKKLEAHPDEVSQGSSMRHVFEHSQAPEEKSDDMLAGIKTDLETIKETFALTEVPRDALYIGAAGVIPYAATSLSTVYLAWDINHAAESGEGYLFTPELARQLLDIVSPIQIGYGAVIISFLGAIHWGLEFSGFGGHHSYRRYMYGVIGPAVAWPTIYMPIEYALITQFTAFVFFYFADARATVRGWFPPWYSTYRFVLTFLVGASIVISLVGRGQIVKHEGHLKSPVDYIKGDRDQQWLALEREENERRKALAKEEEEEGEDESEEGKDDEKEGDDTKEGKKEEEKSGDKKDEKK